MPVIDLSTAQAREPSVPGTLGGESEPDPPRLLLAALSINQLARRNRSSGGSFQQVFEFSWVPCHDGSIL